MSGSIRTDDAQLAKDLKLCREAVSSMKPGSPLYLRLDARRCFGLIEELIEARSQLSAKEKEVKYLRGIMQGQETECRAREEQDRVYRTQITALESQLTALQSVPQGVEVPELTDAFLDLACGPDLSGKADLHSAAFRDLSRGQYRRGWEDLAARLVPTPPQAAPGAVPERAAWLTVQEMADAIYSAFGTHYMVCMDYARAIGAASILKADALRTSAQDHSGEGAK